MSSDRVAVSFKSAKGSGELFRLLACCEAVLSN